MSILLGLTPFIVFFVLMRLVHPLAGLGAAFAVSVLMGFVQWRRGESIKVLEVGSLVLFGALTLYTLIAAPQWTVATVRLAVDGGLFIVAAGVAPHPPALHLAICARERAAGIVDLADILHHQRPHHCGLDGGVRGDDRRRRGRAICRSHSALGRHCRDHRRLCRCGLVHALVSGRGAPPRRSGRQRRQPATRTLPRLRGREGRGLSRADAHKAHRLVQAAQRRAVFGDIAAVERLARFGVGQHRLEMIASPPRH